MYFLVDIFLLAILACVIWASVKFGFTRNFVFGTLRTLLAVAGGAGLCFGLYMLMRHFGWLAYMSDGVRNFFGEVSTNLGTILTDEHYRFASEIIAFIPFGILSFIIGYVIAYFIVKWIVQAVFLPVVYSVKHVRAFKIIDNILGLCFNLAVYLGVVVALFGSVHALNEDGRYKDVTKSGESPTLANKLINEACEPVLDYLHEDFSASIVGGIIYEYNPLNGQFKEWLNKN